MPTRSNDSSREGGSERALVVVAHYCEVLDFAMHHRTDDVLDSLGVRFDVMRTLTAFASLHLISGLFLLDSEDETGLGGMAPAILRSHGFHAEVLRLQEVFARPLGEVTFGGYVRKSRNKLVTHGTWHPESLPPEVKAVGLDPEWADECERCWRDLASEIRHLCWTIQERTGLP